MNSSSENSLLQFERLERQLNGSARRGAPPDQRQPRNQPSIQEVDDDDGAEAHDQTLQLPSHEAFMRQGMAAGDDEAEDGSDVPVELSYQRLLQNSPSIISSGSIERQMHSSAHSSPAPRPSSLSASRTAPKTTPRTSSTTTLMAPLKVPDFKQSELRPPPPPPLSVQKARPMFQSTPHNKKQLLKPTTPGGHQISPIPEEGELDLDRLVSALLDEHQQQQQVATTATAAADQRAVTSMVTQLRDLIAQWDWAKARHRHVEKIYFERQTDEQDARWEQLNAEKSKFNERKADEWAQIAKVRAELHAEREKRMGKKDADRLKELEQELTKLKSKDVLGSQRASEWRTRVRELEGEVRVREQSYTDNLMRIKKLERQLVTAEQENSNLRTRLTLLRSEVAKKKQEEEHQQQPRKVAAAAAAPQLPSSASSSTTNSQHHQQQQLDQNQQQLVAAYRPPPFRMINGPRDRTAAAVHQTANMNMGGDVVVTELVSCRRTVPTTTGKAGRGETVQQQQQQQHTLHRCMLYEWPSTRNFRWTSDGTAHRTSGESVQIDYLHAERLYEVRMPRGHLLRFLLSGQLELHWANGDRTLVLADNERRELFSPEQPNFRMEIFMPTGVAYRLNAQTQWQREAFVPDPARMSVRADGSFVAEHVEERKANPTDRGDALLGRPSLQINSPDFQLRRFADTSGEAGVGQAGRRSAVAVHGQCTACQACVQACGCCF
uniref:Tcp10_C domain-containing protein n=1 Tax=Globodera pallida TaxID=36090 RepID=A0A183CMJ6_GLOPA